MTLSNLSRRLAQVCEIAAALIFLFVCVLNFTQVIGRYATGTSLTWAEEIMRYTMMWVMMLGGSAAIYRAEHMAVDGVVDMVPERLRHLVRSILYGVAGIFCVLLLVYGWPAALANQTQRAAASGIPMLLPYLAIPVGAAIMLAQIVLCWITGFREAPVEEEAW